MPLTTPSQRRALALVASTVTVFGLAACGSSGGSGDLTSVRWGGGVPNPGVGQSIYSSIPLECGFWEEEGLDVEVLGFTGSGASVQALDAGQIDAAIVASPSFIGAVDAGADAIGVYDMVTSGYLVPGVVEDSPITSVKQFEGATIGVQSLESATLPYIQAMMVDAGLEPDSADFVAIGVGAEALSFIQSGRVDVIGLWDAARAELEELGPPNRDVASEKFSELGFQYPIVTTEAMVESDRDVILGLARGIAKSTIFAEENPEAAVRLTWEAYPESRPQGVDEEKAIADGVVVLEARLANSQPIDGLWGNTTTEFIETQIENLRSIGALDGDVSADTLWTQDLIDDINDFDVDAVREMARNAEGTSCGS